MPAKYYTVEFNPLSGVLSYVNATGRRLPIHAGNLPPPLDGNAYPLRMPVGVADGATVTLGTGPNVIQILLSSNPASIVAGPCVVDVFLGDMHIANDLRVTSFEGQGTPNGQLFVLRGSWGAYNSITGFPVITINGSLTEPGDAALWINSVLYDEHELHTLEDYFDARNAKQPTGSTWRWVNSGAPSRFGSLPIPVVAVPPPLPAPDLSLISGATINGATTAPGTLAALALRTLGMGASSTLKLPAGTFVGTASVGPITLEGAGPGLTTIDATGISLTMRKGVLVPTASGFVGRFLRITGAADPDGNGAAVRQAGDGISFTLEDCELTGNQNGILAFNGALVFRRCKIHGNGAGNAGGGATHEIYLSGDNPIAGDALFEDCDLACGILATHALKSRFGRTRFIRGSLLGNADDGTNGGRVVDLPLGGLATFTGSKIARGDGAGNTEIIGFATENTNNTSAGMLLTLDSVAIDSKGADGGKIISRGAGNLLVKGGSTYVGQKPQLEQWASVDGEFVPAA